MPVTIKQLARLAGTSPSTVSRALAASPLVAEATRERIRRLADEHGYSPNALAQGLVTRRSSLLGLMVPDITNPFFAEWAHAAEAEATRAGHSVVLCNTMRRTEQENLHIATLARLRVAGMIVISLDTRNPAVQRLATGDVPVVFCQPPGFTSAPVDIVTGADREGAELAVRHLVDDGRTRIAHLAGSEEAPVTELRRQGYEHALKEAGRSIDPDLVERTEYSEDGGYHGIRRLMERRPDVDAVFAGNDLIAIGAMQALQRSGHTVPDDVAVVGIDDVRLASLVRPALTTVRLPAAEIGREATRTLLDALARPNRSPRTHLIRPTLVIRDSAGPMPPEGG